MQKTIYRGIAKKILIVTPGGLTDQWEEEMRNRFNEEFYIINRELFKTYRHKNIWSEYDKVITSIDFVKQEDVLESLNENNWDLIVVDEAHKFAGKVDVDLFKPNKRYKLGKILCNSSINILFLTATPHKGDNQVFRMLLSLLEPDIFGDEHVLYAPDVNQQIIELEKGNTPIFIRRLKESMVDLEGNKIFKSRRSNTITWTISELETELYRAVSKYVSENFNKALKNKKTTVAFALKIMQRRLLSSSHAIYKTLQKRAKRLQNILDNDDYKIPKSELDQMEREYRLKLDIEWEDLKESERNKIEDKLIQLTMSRNPKELKEEIEILENLQVHAKNVVDQPDQETKLWQMKELLDNNLHDPQEKILIFTEYKDTLFFLEEQIRNWGYSSVSIYGDLNKGDRKKARQEFKNKTQIMIATEAAGEGINLQFCHLLINYDIPWTPTRLEQRLGRIHRYGQKHECYFFNLVSDTAADGKPIAEGDVLATLLRKIEYIQESLGSDRVYDIIGEEIFDDLSLYKVFNIVHSDPNGFFKIKEFLEGDELKQKVKETLNKARSKMTVDLASVNRDTIKSKDMRLWPEYIEDYVHLFLHTFGSKITSTGTITVPLPLRNFSRILKTTYKNVIYEKPDSNLEEDNEINYVSPGHPLLEGIIDYTIGNSSIDLRRGAIFSDQKSFNIGILWFMEMVIEDGNQRERGKKIGLVYQPLDEKLKPIKKINIPIMKLWDFNPIVQNLEIKLPFDTLSIQNQIIEFFHNNQGKEFYEKIKNDTDKRGKIQKAAIKRAYNHQRGYVSKHIFKLRTELKNDQISDKKREKLEKKFKRARKQRESMEQIFKSRNEKFERQSTLSPRGARVIGIALLVPEDDKGEPNLKVLLNEKEREKKIKELSDKSLIDKAAMKFVFEYEREAGRIPRDVSNINCGYDIESSDPVDLQKTRRIEVKGHKNGGDTFISDNEVKMGLRHGKNFWLYDVKNVLKESILRRIQNPALKLFDSMKTITKTTYIIPEKDIEVNCE